MTLAEQIKALTAKLAKAQDARDEMVVKSATAGVALTDEEITTVNTLNTEMEADAKQLEILRVTEKSMAAKAVAVATVTTTAVEPVVTVKSNAPKGSAFTRTAMVFAKAKGDLMLAKSLAEAHYKDDAMVNGIVKAAVAAGSTEVAAWAGNLIYPEQYAGDFIELLYPQTVLGRLNLRKIPFNVRVSLQNAGTSVGWVGEAQPAPVTSAGFDKVFLTWAKVYAISVMSDELIRFSNPAAEALVQADLLKATAKGLDLSFLGTADAVANVSPAGILNGVTAVVATANTAEALIADIQTLVGPFIAANIDMTQAKLLMSPARALAIGSIRNALGNKFFPDMSMNGGVLENFPVLTSNNVSGSEIILVIPDEIYLSEDAGPQIDISREASIIMDSAPGTGTALTAQPVSMFQNNMVAVRIGQFINWQPRRPGLCAGYISGAAYSAT
jgi:HK97 family phage major capsid protein